MKILFTGSSSFTGYWFIRQLIENGHQVIATFRGSETSYDGIRLQRVVQLQSTARCFFDCSFGSQKFLELINNQDQWDLLCHHAADVTDYKNPNFDAIGALSKNTQNLTQVLKALKAKGCSQVVLTGSVFEQEEGIGTDPQRAFSPYGLSKGMTSDYFRYYCLVNGFALGKFVIPNPFGPYEDARLTSYLMQTWAKGGIVEIKTPEYVRDNIHISLLALAYSEFVSSLPKASSFERYSPSGYVEKQGEFVKRFAEAMRLRLGLPCEIVLHDQRDFPEPRIRANSDLVDGTKMGWDEQAAWDAIAAFYKTLILSKSENEC
ncbi:MAG: NAD(P)-dependent oxidoreductase [Nitrosomonas sp.]|nr:MAG: NAD(P)-dependent oxidoreductase [Nitrosomonas sp.]